MDTGTNKGGTRAFQKAQVQPVGPTYESRRGLERWVFGTRSVSRAYGCPAGVFDAQWGPQEQS